MTTTDIYSSSTHPSFCCEGPASIPSKIPFLRGKQCLNSHIIWQRSSQCVWITNVHRKAYRNGYTSTIFMYASTKTNTPQSPLGNTICLLKQKLRKIHKSFSSPDKIKQKWNKVRKQTMQLVRYFAPIPNIQHTEWYRQFYIDKAELQLSGFDRPFW